MLLDARGNFRLVLLQSARFSVVLVVRNPPEARLLSVIRVPPIDAELRLTQALGVIATRYRVATLLEQYGHEGSMIRWKEQLNSDCPNRGAAQLHRGCDLLCPDLPKVL